MKRWSRFSTPMILLLLGAAELLAQGAPSPLNGRTFVVAAGGAGGYTTLTDNLVSIYSCGPLRDRRPIICRIPWARDDENLSDYREKRRHLAGAAMMVREVQLVRKSCPDSPIVLIGYSAGASVVLPAAEQLPACSIERIILLGPGVSANYDVRRALSASKLGIDSFYVPGDPFLDQLEDVFGAPYEGPGTRLAGNIGFRQADPRCGPVNDPLLAKLRQHNVGWLQTGHFGTVTSTFLAQYVSPLIPRGEVRAAPR
jgi:pimeloyl-ACP methyl ester carboxylesterase